MKKSITLAVVFLVITACGPTVTTPGPANATARSLAPTAAATNTPQHSMSPSEMAAMYQSPSPAGTAAASAISQRSPQATSVATIAPAEPTAAAQATTTPATPAPTTVVSGPATTVAVTLTDSAIKLSTLAVAPGKVTFMVTNTGAVEHEFVVLQTNMPQNAIPIDPTNAALVQEPGLLGKVPALAPKSSGSISLNLAAGNYVLICNELAHYTALGMHTGFSVR